MQKLPVYVIFCLTILTYFAEGVKTPIKELPFKHKIPLLKNNEKVGNLKWSWSNCGTCGNPGWWNSNIPFTCCSIASVAHLLHIQKYFSNLISLGSDSDPFQIVSLDLSPDPIVLGQNITVSAKASLCTEI